VAGGVRGGGMVPKRNGTAVCHVWYEGVWQVMAVNKQLTNAAGTTVAAKVACSGAGAQNPTKDEEPAETFSTVKKSTARTAVVGVGEPAVARNARAR